MRVRRREHEGPDHADHQDGGFQGLETLGHVIHQPSECLSRCLSNGRSGDHVPTPPRLPGWVEIGRAEVGELVQAYVVAGKT